MISLCVLSSSYFPIRCEMKMRNFVRYSFATYSIIIAIFDVSAMNFKHFKSIHRMIFMNSIMNFFFLLHLVQCHTIMMKLKQHSRQHFNILNRLLV